MTVENKLIELIRSTGFIAAYTTAGDAHSQFMSFIPIAFEKYEQGRRHSGILSRYLVY